MSIILKFFGLVCCLALTFIMICLAVMVYHIAVDTVKECKAKAKTRAIIKKKEGN